MNHYFIKCLTILIIGSISTSLYCQQKYERESRLKPADVPPAALEFIESAEITSKVKWYIEYGLETKSIEAKFKLNNKRHSVEFDTLGTLDDIEIEILSKELNTNLKKSIDIALSGNCSNHKISKVQKQYTGNQNVLLSLLKNQDFAGNFTTKYEIITSCENESKTEQYEYLFNDEGKLLQQFKIIFSNSSNLEY
ncbi:hypothetical protein [Planktosalinus lacus]|uniref:hypothetical protein n=1 Tax=Planktosalinus lacus TaxID=1526573 RepID=UPI00166D3273|nr:hypothetical protein [Planktosalinus lacus]